MLSEPMREYVKTKNKSDKYNKNVQAVYNSRIRKEIDLALKDLTLLAEELPEKQLEKIFSAETLKPFFKALFQLEIKKAKDHKDWLQKKKELKPRRDRLLKLSGAVLRTIGNGRFAVVLLPESLKFELDQMNSSVENLRVVFYAAMQEQERKKE
jgi:hypothetical protein